MIAYHVYVNFYVYKVFVQRFSLICDNVEEQFSFRHKCYLYNLSIH